jgi:hypothetical protein
MDVADLEEQTKRLPVTCGLGASPLDDFAQFAASR